MMQGTGASVLLRSVGAIAPAVLPPTIYSTATAAAARIITVRDFGAIGDGISDDTPALAMALRYGILTGSPIFLPAGIYLVDPERLSIAGRGKSNRFILFGEGARSVVKVKDGSINGPAKFLLRFKTTHDMDLIEIRDLTFDNNARGSPDPAATGNAWAYQHSHTIQVAPTAGTVKLVRFRNVIIKDPAADGFNCSFRGTASVLEFVVDNCSVTDRSRVRSDVCFVSLPISAHVNGFTGDVMEVEAVAPSAQKIKLLYTNCKVKRLDFIAHTQDWMTGNVEVSFDAVIAAEKANFSGVVLTATRCVFGISTDAKFNRWHVLQPGSQITETLLLHKYDERTNMAGSLTVLSSRTYGWRSNLRLVSCESRIDDNNKAVGPRGAAIVGLPGESPAVLDNAFLHVEHHKFDARFETSVYADRCGRVSLIENDYGGTSCAIKYRPGAPEALELSVSGGDFRRVKGTKIEKQSRLTA